MGRGRSKAGGGGVGGVSKSLLDKLEEKRLPYIEGDAPLGSLTKQEYTRGVGSADGLSSPDGTLKHITLYHGSFSDFDEFDYAKGKEAKGGGADMYGAGFYLTSDPNRARAFGDIVYKVDVAYSTSRVVGKLMGREIDFQYNPDTGYWVIPASKAEHLKILSKRKVD